MSKIYLLTVIQIKDLIRYIDNIVSTINPAVLPDDGSYLSNAPPQKVNPHICNKSLPSNTTSKYLVSAHIACLIQKVINNE